MAAEMYLGQRAPDTVLEAATKAKKSCEAQFHLGEWHLLNNDRAAASLALNAAVKDCYHSQVEREVAAAELRRL